MTKNDEIPKILRGKEADDPVVRWWQDSRLLTGAIAALDRCFNELGYDDEQIEEFLSDDLFEEWELWRKKQSGR